MFRTVEAVIDPNGAVQLLEPLLLKASTRLLITILETENETPFEEPALLSQSALSDWNRPEEDEVWAYLQQAP